jgi:hypothetical protein
MPAFRLLHCAARALLGAFLIVATQATGAGEPPTLAIVGFELLENEPDPSRDADQQRRLGMIHAQIRTSLAEAGLYRIVPVEPAHDVLARLRDRHEFLYRCDACLTEVGEALGADLVAAGWVQKVSNLIININIVIRDVREDRLVLTKSVDIRGNTDETWTRGVRFLVRDMSERRARDPRYGVGSHDGASSSGVSARD